MYDNHNAGNISFTNIAQQNENQLQPQIKQCLNCNISHDYLLTIHLRQQMGANISYKEQVFLKMFLH